MFYSLPAETVFEAKERTRRATFYLFILLVGLYIFFANLMVLAAASFARGWFMAFTRNDILQPSIFYWTTLGAIVLAMGHFVWVRQKPLDDLLSQIKARPADPQDRYHQQFINLVGEMEAATGLRGIRPVVLVDPGANAFSLMDGNGNCAIGVTEGLLAKLTRPELSAVLAHEGAHLVHEDSRLVTTACFLFAVFGRINGAMTDALSSGRSSYSYYDSERRSSSRGGNLTGAFLVLWLISGAGYLVTKLVSMAISREREYLADADGVSMCKDPLGMAEALYKISRRYRGQVPDSYSALFILNPGESAMDEHGGLFADLFSNHPPVSNRLEKLLDWAKSDMASLLKQVDQEEGGGPSRSISGSSTPPQAAQDPVAQASPVPAASPAQFMAYKDSQWQGPFSPQQMMAQGLLDPSAWVCPVGTQDVQKASETAALLPLLAAAASTGEAGKGDCPRCKVPLASTNFEGCEVAQCPFCKGHLLRGGVLERLITREDVTYSPEEIKKAKTWRDQQRGPLRGRDAFPLIKCPLCADPMGKGIHTMLTQVVIDHCTKAACGAVWCDGGELETIRMIIQDAHATPLPAI